MASHLLALPTMFEIMDIVRSIRILQLAILIVGIGMPPVAFSEGNTFTEQTEMAVSKAIRSLRSKQPEQTEIIQIRLKEPMITRYARPVTWISEYVAGSGFTIGHWYSQSVKSYFEVSAVMEKEVYKLGSSTVHGSKPGELRLSSPLQLFTYKDPLRPNQFLTNGREDVVLLLPLVDPWNVQDLGDPSIALIANNDILPQARISKDPPRVLLERNEKYMLEAFKPGSMTFESDWFIPSMSNIASFDSTMFGHPSRITTFEWERGIYHYKHYIEVVLFPDNRFVTLTAKGLATQFSNFMQPVIDVVRKESIVQFPPLKETVYSTSSSSVSKKKSVMRCSGTKAAILLCRKQTSKVQK